MISQKIVQQELGRKGGVRFADVERTKQEFKKKVHDLDKDLYKMEFQARSIMSYSSDLDFTNSMLNAFGKVYKYIKLANEELNKVGSEVNKF